jgi:hypothetical protein
MIKNRFSELLVETIRMSEGIISPDVATSGELVTDLTAQSERETQFYTNIYIDPNITRMEKALAISTPKQGRF